MGVDLIFQFNRCESTLEEADTIFITRMKELQFINSRTHPSHIGPPSSVVDAPV